MKTKTNRNLIKILCAVLSVVFAFAVGITYAASSATIRYGSAPKSTQAYFANQQVHIINDTVQNPIPYGNNTNSFEVAIQYSIDYDFDLRLKYSLKYDNGVAADNVILNFVNRDNVIYDTEYIYLADSFEAGMGKIPLIANVEFADDNNDALIGRRLIIEIKQEDVKFYKASINASFYDVQHKLYSDVSSSIAAQAWLQNKHNKLSTGTTAASVVMYNYRRNAVHGVSFPGDETAYKKSIRTTADNGYVVGNVYGASWAGGNTALAGIGMYVISGSQNIRLQVQVAGIWRDNDTNSETFISENNVKFNYSTNWNFSNYSSNNLWEVRMFNYDIPKQSSCYIDILESIEVTCAGVVEGVDYDDYRLVANSIVVNELSTNTKTTFSYNERTDRYIQFKTISSTAYSTLSPAQNIYSQDSVRVVNITKYSSNLYDAFGGNQTFNSGVVLINNSSEQKQVKLNLGLEYSISNANIKLFNDLGERADSFDDDMFFKQQFVDSNNRLNSSKEVMLKLDAGSAITAISTYSVSENLKNDILIDDLDTSNFAEYYDVWTSLSATVSEASVDKTNLTIETSYNGGKTSLWIKNNTCSTISGVEIANLSVSEVSSTYELETSVVEPFDWETSFWKYYTYSAGSYKQLKTAESYEANAYYKKVETASNVSGLTYISGFAVNGGVVTNQTVSLKSGETVKFAECSAQNVIVSGFAKATLSKVSQTLDLVDSGKNSAYLINNSQFSYYVRFTGSLAQSSTRIYTNSGYNYYIGLIVPGQILNIKMSSEGELETIQAADVFNAEDLEGWNETAVSKIDKYFTTKI